MTRFDTPYNVRAVPPHHDRPDDLPTAAGAQSVAGASPPGSRGARPWNSWWSRRSPNLAANDSEPVRIGIDAGSKTIKVVALDTQGDIVHALYHRHRSDVATTLAEALHEFIWRFGDWELPVAITGSAGIALGEALGLPFVQEVVATTTAVKAHYPQADCIIELGGEDAKVTYLTGQVEQRMNATCAGGTGDFIDGIASMLGVRTREMSKLALGHRRTYPIASRCAVFAQTDVRPLINAGASKADIAQSALEAVVRQTLGGLACGRPLGGTVVFLGGPLEHIPALVMAFRKKLGLDRHTGIKPSDAHLFTAMGAVLDAHDAPAVSLSELEARARGATVADDAGHLPPLFDDEGERRAFVERHARERVARKRLDDASGPLFLGFDAGSTTMKYALVDDEGALVAWDYREVEGDTLGTAREMLEEVLMKLRRTGRGSQRKHIAHATVTGYGEDLLVEAFGFDSGVVETVAHLRAAQQFAPDASFVLDIGGQDMKALWVREGRVTDAVLNEACSSGCGAFVQSSAKSLEMTPTEFSNLALEAENPIDLGAKCTVFMTSRVRHAQKAGADRRDIAAGIAYSVANNVMTRIIGKQNAGEMGQTVVVQGGTFKSDAVLRAFEKVAGVQAVRPDAAHLMGAYGAALVACDRSGGTRVGAGAERRQHEVASRLLALDEVHALSPCKKAIRCSGCSNACLLTVVEFGGNRRFVSGNRCERAYDLVIGPAYGAEGGREGADAGSSPVAAGRHGDGRGPRKAPNVVALEQRLLAGFGDVRADGARGSVAVGVMNAMNVYEALPFWHTLLVRLGFSVLVPNDGAAAHLADRASETIPSESVCHPAKVAHLRYAYLVEAGADHVLMPLFERGTRCAVAEGYRGALADNVGEARLVSPVLHSHRPRSIAGHADDRAALAGAVARMLPPGDGLAPGEFDAALSEALAAQRSFADSVARATERALAWAKADPTRRVAVLFGRPYHMDPTLLHRIDHELARLGFAVVPPLGLKPRLKGLLAAKGLWKPSKELLGHVALSLDDPQVEIVALRSFGCLYDAVSFDEARDVALEAHRPFTALKIDDITNTAHIRIRLRTLAFTSGLGAPAVSADGAAGETREGAETAGNPGCEESAPAAIALSKRSGAPTPDLCSTVKALIGQAAAAIEENPRSESLVVPVTCVDCLEAALPFELKHLFGGVPAIGETRLSFDRPSVSASPRRVGLLGNPLIVFDPELNDNVARLVEWLGWEPVFPDERLMAVDDVRYLEQLERYRAMGVRRVIYLQSFGCLKGHVQSRGALHGLARRFPELSITVVDYDPESSALNRENRIRLALS